MHYQIEKSSIPVLWFDTFAIRQIAYELYQKKTSQPYDERLVNSFSELVKMRIEKKIIFFESDQMLEISVRPELTKICGQVLTQLSGSLIVRPWEVKEKQIQLALKAFVGQSKTELIKWDDIYTDDPLKDRSILGVLIRVDFGTGIRLAQKRKTDKSVFENWQKIRERFSGSPTRKNYPKQYALEKRGGVKLAKDIIKKMKDENDEQKPYLLYAELIQKISSYLKALNPDIEDAESAVIDFYGSEYYMNLPMNEISSVLYAEKLCGNEKLKLSDQADIDNISSFLPYVNYMLIDKSMIDKVEKHGLDKKYSTKLLRLNQLEQIVKKINSSAQT